MWIVGEGSLTINLMDISNFDASQVEEISISVNASRSKLSAFKERE